MNQPTLKGAKASAGGKNSRVSGGAILAGGENRRITSVKALLKIDGQTIIENNLRLLQGIFDTVFISTNRPELYFPLGVPLFGDIVPSRGPMSGIHACLVNAGGESLFVVACDMPFLSRDIISLVCAKHEEASRSRATGATVPVFNGKPQPLCAVYSKSIVADLEKAVSLGKVSLRRFLDEIETTFIKEAEVKAVEPEGRSFININTMEDYEAALSQSGRLHGAHYDTSGR